MKHDQRHEAVLTALLAGDLSEDAPDVRAQLDACGSCRERWRALAGFTRRIDALEREKRAVLEEAARPGRAPGAERVAAHLAQLRPPHAGASSQPRPIATPEARSITAPEPPPIRSIGNRRRWLFAVVAAGLLVALGVGYFAQRQPATDDLLLGSESIEALAPLGDVRVFEAFEWQYPVRGGDYFELVIRGAGAGAELARERLEAARFSFAPTQTSRWPDEIQWQVFAYDATDVELAHSPRSSARRVR